MEDDEQVAHQVEEVHVVAVRGPDSEQFQLLIQQFSSLILKIPHDNIERNQPQGVVMNLL